MSTPCWHGNFSTFSGSIANPLLCSAFLSKTHVMDSKFVALKILKTFLRFNPLMTLPKSQMYDAATTVLASTLRAMRPWREDSGAAVPARDVAVLGFSVPRAVGTMDPGAAGPTPSLATDVPATMPSMTSASFLLSTMRCISTSTTFCRPFLGPL